MNVLNILYDLLTFGFKIWNAIQKIIEVGKSQTMPIKNSVEWMKKRNINVLSYTVDISCCDIKYIKRFLSIMNWITLQ